MQDPRRASSSAPTAVTFIRKLNGSSQPAIIVTTGLHAYVVKFGNFTGRMGLVAEVIGTEVLRLMGLPVPPWVPVQVDHRFIDANPEMWFSNQSGKGLPPKAGLHFGSRVTLSEGDRQTYQIIPQKWIDRILNPGDFIGTLLVDLWLNNCDRRQCLFQQDASGLRAVFIDNDHMLGGYYGNERTTPSRAVAPYPEIYRMGWSKATLADWEERLDCICDSHLEEVFDKVPSEWADCLILERIRSALVRRRASLAGLVDEAERSLRRGREPLSLPAATALEPHWGCG